MVIPLEVVYWYAAYYALNSIGTLSAVFLLWCSTGTIYYIVQGIDFRKRTQLMLESSAEQDS